MGQSSHGSTGALPGDGDLVEFNGSSEQVNLAYAANFQGAGGGIGGWILRSTPTTAVTLNSISGNHILRLGTNAGITLEQGAGALTLGNVAGSSTVINIGGSNGTANFINNSTSLATLGIHSMLNRGGCSSAHALVFGGIGNWDLLGTVNAHLDHQLTKTAKTGTGNLRTKTFYPNRAFLPLRVGSRPQNCCVFRRLC